MHIHFIHWPYIASHVTLSNAAGAVSYSFFETPNKTLISGQTSKKCDPARQGDPICVVYERWTGVLCVHKEPTIANHWTNLPCVCVHVCLWYMPSCACVWDILVSRLSAPEVFPKLLRVTYQHWKKVLRKKSYYLVQQIWILLLRYWKLWSKKNPQCVNF